MNKPTFLIVGAAKSGTTMMYHILNEHSEVFMPTEKEPHFFSEIKAPGYIHDIEEYFNTFNEIKNENNYKEFGEASVTYLPFYINTIQKIKNTIGDVKIIIVLRNPIERAWSHYTYYLKLQFESNEFKDTLSQNYIPKNDPWGGKINPYLIPGLYFEAVESYLNEFSNVHIILHDELKNDFQNTINDLFKFLDIENSGKIENVKRNVSGIPKNNFIAFILANRWLSNNLVSLIPPTLKDKLRKVLMKRPKIDEKSKEFLKEYYLEDINKLEKLLNKDLKEWKK